MSDLKDIDESEFCIEGEDNVPVAHLSQADQARFVEEENRVPTERIPCRACGALDDGTGFSSTKKCVVCGKSWREIEMAQRAT